MKNKIGLCFSPKFEGEQPLAHIGRKLPVYLRFLNLLQKKSWDVYVLTRLTYQGSGVFKGAWYFNQDRFWPINKAIKINLVYDRTGGLKFPPLNDAEMIVVNRLDFKKLCWDKWQAYQKLGKDMPQTFWVGEKENLAKILTRIKTDWVVLKPYNGLKGLGIFIGPKKKALNFKFSPKYRKYIAQEFIDTSFGIPGIISGWHDLRVVIVNGQPVWSHVRVPPPGGFKANAAGGGILKEVDCRLIPDSVQKIVNKISEKFYRNYDNPVFSLDFGLDKKGKPFIFEINDQIGFPRWEMKARDLFLNQLIINFEEKIKKIKNGQNA